MRPQDENVERARRDAGLCFSCRHARVIQSSRGSTFYLCRKSETDQRFARYPRLPVTRCEGFETSPTDFDRERATAD